MRAYFSPGGERNSRACRPGILCRKVREQGVRSLRTRSNTSLICPVNSRNSTWRPVRIRLSTPPSFSNSQVEPETERTVQFAAWSGVLFSRCAHPSSSQHEPLASQISRLALPHSLRPTRTVRNLHEEFDREEQYDDGPGIDLRGLILRKRGALSEIFILMMGANSRTDAGAAHDISRRRAISS